MTPSPPLSLPAPSGNVNYLNLFYLDQKYGTEMMHMVEHIQDPGGNLVHVGGGGRVHYRLMR